MFLKCLYCWQKVDKGWSSGNVSLLLLLLLLLLLFSTLVLGGVSHMRWLGKFELNL